MDNTTTKEKPQFTFTDKYRGTYTFVTEAKAFKKKGQIKGDPKYSSMFLIEPKYIEKDGKKIIDPSSDLGRLQAEVVRMLKAKYPGKKLVVGRRMTQEELDSGEAVEVNVPWFKGEKEGERLKAKGKEADAAIYAGKFCVKGSSKYRPLLDVIEGGKVVSLTTDEAVKASAGKYFYSGAWFLPTFGLHAYDGDEGKSGGVSMYLNALLFCAHGERLGGRSHNPAEAYKGYLGKISDEDPTGGAASEELDDEIPF